MNARAIVDGVVWRFEISFFDWSDRERIFLESIGNHTIKLFAFTTEVYSDENVLMLEALRVEQQHSEFRNYLDRQYLHTITDQEMERRGLAKSSPQPLPVKAARGQS